MDLFVYLDTRKLNLKLIQSLYFIDLLEPVFIFHAEFSIFFQIPQMVVGPLHFVG